MAKKVVSDSDVFHYWKCDDCENIEIVSPDWYQDNGTPVCENCDGDMTYNYTEIEVKD